MNPAILKALRAFPRLARAFFQSIPPERLREMAKRARAKSHRHLKAADQLMTMAKDEKGRSRRRILRQARRARRHGGEWESVAGFLDGRAER